eukprot:IDg13228t1
MYQKLDDCNYIALSHLRLCPAAFKHPRYAVDNNLTVLIMSPCGNGQEALRTAPKTRPASATTHAVAQSTSPAAAQSIAPAVAQSTALAVAQSIAPVAPGALQATAHNSSAFRPVSRTCDRQK